MNDVPKVFLKRGREFAVRKGHPWVYSGAVARAESGVEGAGEVVDVCTDSGEFIGRGIANARSQIAVRIWTRRPEPIGPEFFLSRVRRALELRRNLGLFGEAGETPAACRLLYGEADGIPGVIADVYAGAVVLQVLSLGAELRKDALVRALREVGGFDRIYERSEGSARTREGLAPASGPLAGPPPEGPVEIVEYGARYLVDVVHGQKTGFYLDQRENRRRVAELLAAAARNKPGTEPVRVLNLFSYTGAFGIAACRASDRVWVLNVDASRDALALAEKNAERNGVGERMRCREGNAFEVLRSFRDARRSFDAVIVDPPRFANSASGVQAACRGYKDLNLLALKLLAPEGGLLCTFSCSGRVGEDLFRKVVASAARDAGREIAILARLHQGPDHPLLPMFPEGEYLKGLVVAAGALEIGG